MLRDGHLTQLTTDDIVLNHAADLGLLPEQIPPLAHALTRALGYLTTVDKARVVSFDLRADDVLLLCTRGLHAALDTATLERALTTSQDPITACRMLQDLAVSADARYNITTLIARQIKDSPRAPTPVGR